MYKQEVAEAFKFNYQDFKTDNNLLMMVANLSTTYKFIAMIWTKPQETCYTWYKQNQSSMMVEISKSDLFDYYVSYCQEL